MRWCDLICSEFLSDDFLFQPCRRVQTKHLWLWAEIMRCYIDSSLFMCQPKCDTSRGESLCSLHSSAVPRRKKEEEETNHQEIWGREWDINFIIISPELRPLNRTMSRQRVTLTTTTYRVTKWLCNQLYSPCSITPAITYWDLLYCEYRRYLAA